MVYEWHSQSVIFDMYGIIFVNIKPYSYQWSVSITSQHEVLAKMVQFLLYIWRVHYGIILLKFSDNYICMVYHTRMFIAKSFKIHPFYINLTINVIFTFQFNSFTGYNSYNQVWLCKTDYNHVIIYTYLFKYLQDMMLITWVLPDI